MFTKALVVASALAGAMAQRPENSTICDYYTTALLTNNTAANQMTLLTLVVNTAVIGNYTKPNVGIMVPGILAPGEVNGTKVNLAGYFNGGFASTNKGGSSGEAVNFLDGGGAAPLMNNTAAMDMTSNQYTLLTHLYEYFGTLLGCSEQGKDGYPAYNGANSMYTVHKYMGLNEAEIVYFVTQVGLSAASFGVAEADVTAVGKTLLGAFGMKCAPEAVIIPTQPAALQAICIADDCPEVTANSTCSSYAAVVEPTVANATLAGTTDESSSSSMSGSMTATATTGTPTGTGTATTSPAATISNNAGAVNQVSWAAGLALVGAAFL